jgi:hypothetical protein
MRAIALLASTLVLAVSAFGQPATTSPHDSAQSASPAQTAPDTAEQPPEHPITPAQVHEILELTGAHRLAVQMMRGMMGYLQKSFPPYMPKDVMDDLEASLEKIDLEPMAVKTYQQHISTEDAVQIIAFYKTPAGRRVVDVMPMITEEMQESGAKAGMQISQEVLERHMDEIKAAAAKYQQEHSGESPTVTSPD